MRALWKEAAAALALLAAGPALAAGGAHVIDDSEVETPGTCHVESWITRNSGESGLVNSAPACTTKAWPHIELGGFVMHDWTADASTTLIGLSPKFSLRSESTGLGIGVTTNLGFNVDRSRLETGAVIMPLTLDVGKRVRVNLNGGWAWARTSDYSLFVGGQVEFAMTPTLGLMGEVFTHDTGKAGGQTGLRWMSDHGRMNLDVLVGRYADGTTPTAVTIGLSIRR
ncbi:MAG TPA: hypothetical protein VNS79_15025 [Sphingobium sp.]|nr:hypothetical protein [Sphingobium sp.]